MWVEENDKEMRNFDRKVDRYGYRDKHGDTERYDHTQMYGCRRHGYREIYVYIDIHGDIERYGYRDILRIQKNIRGHRRRGVERGKKKG